jgi:methylated-DNA-[protein]-cysteine S-methyltransferase
MTQAHPDIAAQACIATPLGPLTAAATERGLAGLWFDGQAHHPGPLAAPCREDHPVLVAARRALQAYFDGDWRAARRLHYDLHGTPFQRAVWQALLQIEAGCTASYAQVAAQAGVPLAARAAGAAIARNPVSILVPCHRVVGASGALTGYAGGLERKRALLRHERVAVA